MKDHGTLNLQVKCRKNKKEDEMAISEFMKIQRQENTEAILYVNLDSADTQSKFLDKFYLVEVHETQGIVCHGKVDYDILADNMVRRICVVPKNLNDHKVVCIFESKFLPIINQTLENIEIDKEANQKFDDEYLSKRIIQQIATNNSYKLYCRGAKSLNKP